MPTNLFLSPNPASINAYTEAITAAQQLIATNWATLTQPYSGQTPQELQDLLAATQTCPETGRPLEQVLHMVAEQTLQHTLAVHHPRCVAHLHCPPLIPALAAELLLSAMNASLDSWDQSTAATILEQKIIAWLDHAFQLGDQADGVFTSGGTQSNLMGLLIARNVACQTHFHCDVQAQGLPPEASRLRIFCSEAAHFSIQQAAAILGLGANTVIPIPTNSQWQLSIPALETELEKCRAANLVPMAIVATAGTTDFASFDPLPELSRLATQWSCWLHVDAALGGACILSDQLRSKLDGIAQADSIAIDFHKLFYQPLSCSAFLLKESTHFAVIKQHAAYLNPETDEAAGIPHLVGKSLQTSRRFDALKCWVTMQTLGRQQLASLLETMVTLTQQTAKLLQHDPQFELLNPEPALNTLVFRYLSGDQTRDNDLNQVIRQQLFQQGQAVIAQTQVAGKIYLKFTLLNPHTTLNDIKYILAAIKEKAGQYQTKGAQEQHV